MKTFETTLFCGDKNFYCLHTNSSIFDEIRKYILNRNKFFIFSNVLKKNMLHRLYIKLPNKNKASADIIFNDNINSLTIKLSDTFIFTHKESDIPINEVKIFNMSTTRMIKNFINDKIVLIEPDNLQNFISEHVLYAIDNVTN